ncbi:glyoxal reductase [Clostridiales bacterium]|nr:glyoxal reductase [Clostridiales bacterium]
MKKILISAFSFICMITLSACGSVLGAQQQPDGNISEIRESIFKAVEENIWYSDAVEYCVEHGIMTGISDEKFMPDEPMTRAMVAEAIYNMTDKASTAGTSEFTDVAADSDDSAAVAWVSDQGYMSGYGNGQFGADDSITREQITAILWRYANSPTGEITTEFEDASEISQWALQSVNWAKSAGIISGKENGHFDPKSNITRAEAAMIIYNLINSKQVEIGAKEKYGGSKVLVAYFSATGTTKLLAEYTAEIMNGDIYEIVPETPYTSEDLEYGNSSSRTSIEQNDSSARPVISGNVTKMEDYDTVFLGYPIWWGQAPRIINTFLESYDFAGKTIVPFCTSQSSGIGSSDTSLHSLAPNANWLAGSRFASGTTQSTVEEWINGLNLPIAVAAQDIFDFDKKTVMLNSGYEMPVYGLGTYSLEGDTCINSVSSALNSGVRLIDTAYIYQNEESVGEAIRNSGIPREEIFVITKLYPSQFSNPETAIDEALEKLDIGYIDMMLLHHPGTDDVKAYKAMEKAVEDGKIRSIGLSNWYIQELNDFLPQVSIKPALVQNEIHPYYQENDVIEYIHSLVITVQGWYPLGGRGHTKELLENEVISEIAKTHGKSSAQIILRWNLQKGVVVIPGSSNPDHIQENTELFDFELTKEEMNRINALDRNEKHDWY